MNQELKDKILYWAGWFGLGVTAIWIILKAIGIIHSPDWVQMLPYAGVVFWAGVMYQTLSQLKEEVKEIKTEHKQFDKRLISIENKLI